MFVKYMFVKYINRLFSALVMFLVLFSSSLMFASASFAFDDNEKAEIEKIIRDYIIKNPEIMLEAQQALQVKQEIEAQEKAAEALKSNKEIVFNSPHQATIGNEQADVTIVEFFDYNCHYCQKAMQDMQNLLAGDKNLKFVMKELPILSRESVDAHRISTAVYRLFPAQYGAFHNALLGGEGPKDSAKALAVVESMGLDVTAIKAESEKDGIIEAFREVNDLANTLGINGTPSYVIGNEVIFGALGEQVLREKVENIRTCGKTTCE